MMDVLEKASLRSVSITFALATIEKVRLLTEAAKTR